MNEASTTPDNAQTSSESDASAPQIDHPSDYGYDLYRYLDVDSNATPEQISKAYKRKAKKLHPDMHAADNQDKATAAFKKLNEVNQVLSDPVARKSYDREFTKFQAEQNRRAGAAAPNPQSESTQARAEQSASANASAQRSYDERKARQRQEENARQRYNEAAARASDFFNQERRRAHQRGDASWGTGTNTRTNTGTQRGGETRQGARRPAESTESASSRNAADRIVFGEEQNESFTFEDALSDTELAAFNSYIDSAKTPAVLIQNFITFARTELNYDIGNANQKRQLVGEMMMRLPNIDQRIQQRLERVRTRRYYGSEDRVLRKAIDRVSSRIIRDKLNELAGFEDETHRIIFG